MRETIKNAFVARFPWHKALILRLFLRNISGLAAPNLF